jgi:hypothetical protein
MRRRICIGGLKSIGRGRSGAGGISVVILILILIFIIPGQRELTTGYSRLSGCLGTLLARSTDEA